VTNDQELGGGGGRARRNVGRTVGSASAGWAAAAAGGLQPPMSPASSSGSTNEQWSSTSEPWASTDRQGRALPSGLLILVADDIKSNRAVQRITVSTALKGATFTEASTGEEALQLLLEKDFDIALLDEVYSNTPEEAESFLRGTDVTRIFRDARPEANTVIIGCTAVLDFDSHRTLADNTGQDAVWGKPGPKARELVHELQRLLAAREPQRMRRQYYQSLAALRAQDSQMRQQQTLEELDEHAEPEAPTTSGW